MTENSPEPMAPSSEPEASPAPSTSFVDKLRSLDLAPSTVDRALNVAIAVLIVGIIGLVGLFGYTIYRNSVAAVDSGAATRVARALERQVRRTPNDAALRVRLGESYGAAGRYDAAVEQFTQALKIDPKHVGAYLDLGLVAMLDNQNSKAVSYFRKVLELTDSSEYSNLDSRRELALYNLGSIALEGRKYADAAGYFKEALRIRKDASDTYLQLARALRGLGDTDGAIENLDTALAFDPGFAEAHYLEGQIYTELKDTVRAAQHYSRAVELAPDADPPREALDALGSVDSWVSKAEKLHAAGDLKGATEAAEVARYIDPKNAKAAVLHGELLLEGKNYKGAQAAFEVAVRLLPDDKDVAASLAKAKKLAARTSK